MPATEMDLWIAYAAIEPIGEKRQDLRFAMLACTIANLIRGACGSKGKASKLQDFMLKFDPPKQQSKSDMKSILRSVSG